ncbi:MAG: hypothetical protein WCQ99_09190 [Pseudomonadota bacterium]
MDNKNYLKTDCNCTIKDRYFDLRTLSKYSSLSVRTLRDYLTDPGDPLPSYRLTRKILVKRSEFDQWVSRHRTKNNDLSDMVNDILKDISVN